MTTTVPPTTQTENSYLSGNWAPVRTEVTATDLEVTGSIPEYLDGRYLRIGPNPLGDPDPQRYHVFLGEGMVRWRSACWADPPGNAATPRPGTPASPE
jgi:carotenoid cleavage dioxygenase